ncbi:hypothetical protein A3A76_05810 [Candidatus Woesebacteria bacterium RIFCSPLOWO2_01_FULL_39_23]|uniref:Dihydrofolate reductase n=1 Tax=Candidatus Woesebacteria bacterium RIFCSPHIGHO2_01_FULL_40_22 TaxID=1802499 RepID=A0A1F7YHV4_9BACT|nr:MAG: hypothetical protein A2141_02505 [Candidatus Woesebacteria bacterium RBG_16_40_11]OGM26916.1 MAG: hypothetical protein A2628_05750 [Candidatus Woesebacteria bacterium RIFCSPHIGHO2_01_FULL_40_22]OGM37326.1 MAG: hypothetical protein A3E41_04150 [Candidatus Woesebacteria bacterium RIFCSPHIGHO2_12_FULL_38_9]OGM63191.1 MAG: hypothetical protein A3A76_05810 [Candidatus Woesebacteria bacterium RIFCSPLOWO2_01_FULL_39_23]
MKVSIIVAVAENNVIGAKNKLPWYLPADLKHFKELTTGHHILMGQKTYESIGKPLPDRVNIILSEDPNYHAKECIVVNSINEGVELAKSENEHEFFIIGGASVYKQMLPFTDKIYMTKIHNNFDGDVYFPNIDDKNWREISKESHTKDDKNPFDYDFIILEKR